MSTNDHTYTVRRLAVEVSGVRELQHRYEQAVPPNPRKDVAALLDRRASWPEVLDCRP
jgi:hypothetical protein